MKRTYLDADGKRIKHGAVYWHSDWMVPGRDMDGVVTWDRRRLAYCFTALNRPEPPAPLLFLRLNREGTLLIHLSLRRQR